MSSHTQLRKEKWSKLHELLEADESTGAKENKLKSLIDSLITASLIDELGKAYKFNKGCLHPPEMDEYFDQRISGLKE